MDATLQKIGEIVLNVGFFALEKWQSGEFTTKQNTARPEESMDFDTTVDKEANARFVKALRELGITDKFLTEEGIKNKEFNASGAVRWVCDPLDGTSNFKTGEPDWGHSVALEDNGAIRYACLFLPARGEFLLAHGTNTYFLNTYNKPREALSPADAAPFRTENSRFILPQKVTTEPLRKIRCYIHPGRKRNYELSPDNPLNRLYAEIANPACTFSCVSALAKVALGKLDGAVIGFQNYWDFAAGRKIIETAGGEFAAYPLANNLNDFWPLRRLTGLDFSNAAAINSDGAEWQCHIIAARNTPIFFALRDFITGKHA